MKSTEKRNWLDELSDEAKLLRMDGLPNVMRSQASVKYVWLAIFVISSSICVYLIIGSVHEYLKYEVITKSRLLQDQRINFPIVSICAVNPYTTDYSVELMEKLNFPFAGDYSAVMLAIEKHVHNTTGSYISDEQKQMLINFDHILLSCHIGQTKCNSSMFYWTWNPIMYNCYNFNTGLDANGNQIEKIQVDAPGSTYQLDLILYAGLPDYWSGMIGTYGLRGFYIYIHNETDYPYNLAPSPILITPGLGTQVSLSRSFYEQYNEWPYAYSECRVNAEGEVLGAPLADPSLFEEVKATNYSYSRSTCILFCAQLETTKACECNNYVIPNWRPEVDVCISPEQKKCADDFFYFTFIDGDFIKQKCLAKCPLECTQRQLTTSLAYYKYPTADEAAAWSAQSLSELQNQTDFWYAPWLEHNLVRVSFYYDTLSYTLSEEKAAMSLDNLIGVLGGHLHLFLGMSFLSFVELVELTIIAITLHIEHKKHHKLQIANHTANHPLGH